MFLNFFQDHLTSTVNVGIIDFRRNKERILSRLRGPSAVKSNDVIPEPLKHCSTYWRIWAPDYSSFHKSGISWFHGHERRIPHCTDIERYLQRSTCYFAPVSPYRTLVFPGHHRFELERNTGHPRYES